MAGDVVAPDHVDAIAGSLDPSHHRLSQNAPQLRVGEAQLQPVGARAVLEQREVFGMTGKPAFLADRAVGVLDVVRRHIHEKTVTGGAGHIRRLQFRQIDVSGFRASPMEVPVSPVANEEPGGRRLVGMPIQGVLVAEAVERRAAAGFVA